MDTKVIIVNKIGQEPKVDLLRNAINNAFSVHQDTDALEIWETWNGSKDMVYIINRCGVNIKQLSAFGPPAKSWFEMAYSNSNQEDEEACICGTGQSDDS